MACMERRETAIVMGGGSIISAPSGQLATFYIECRDCDTCHIELRSGETLKPDDPRLCEHLSRTPNA